MESGDSGNLDAEVNLTLLSRQPHACQLVVDGFVWLGRIGVVLEGRIVVDIGEDQDVVVGEARLYHDRHLCLDRLLAGHLHSAGGRVDHLENPLALDPLQESGQRRSEHDAEDCQDDHELHDREARACGSTPAHRGFHVDNSPILQRPSGETLPTSFRPQVVNIQ